jgi:glycosyltransferase 2 family protein
MSGRKTLWRIAQLVILAAVLFGIYRLLAPELRSLRWEDFRQWRPSTGRLVLSFVALLGMYLMHAFLWRRIAMDLGVGQPDARTTVRIYFVASLGRYIPGKVWQIAGFAVLAGRAGMPPGGATAAALLGQFGFLATGLIFVAVLLPEWMSGLPLYLSGFLLVSAAGALWILTATPAGHRAREWAARRLGRTVGDKLGSALDLADRMRGRDAIRWSVGYGVSWILLGLAFSLFATAFVPAAITDTRLLAGTIAASYLAGYVVLVAPGGIGVRESAMTALLAAVPGFPISAAVVVSVLSRVWFTLGELLPLALVPLLPASPAAAGRPAGPDPSVPVEGQ